MTLSSHHKAALVGAVATSGIALTDAVTHGVSGHYSVFSDDSDLPVVVALGGVAHGLTYLALCFVLLREADRFRAANRVARAARWIVLASLALLAPGFLLISPVLNLTDVGEGAAFTIWGGMAGVAFFGMIFGSLVLGLALYRDANLGLGARVLAMMLPVLGLTLLLAWAAPAWAHPAYLEATLHFGIALLGVSGTTPAPSPQESGSVAEAPAS